MVMAEGFSRKEVESILNDPQRSTLIGEKEKALFPFAEKATKEPWKIAKSDIQKLRDNGCTDEEILEISLVVAKFNMLDRIADLLGAPLDYRQDTVEEEFSGMRK